MFDILVFVYEHCRQADVSADPELVAKRLSAAGFEDADISMALTWLAGLVRAPRPLISPLPEGNRTFRAYSPRELAKLDVECRGFLLSLECANIISAQTREHVLERALATGNDQLSLPQLQLIVLMVLWSEQAPASRLVAEELRTIGRERLVH